MRTSLQVVFMLTALVLVFQFDRGVRSAEWRYVCRLLGDTPAEPCDRGCGGYVGYGVDAPGGGAFGRAVPLAEGAFPDGVPVQALWVGPGWYCVKGYGGSSPSTLRQVAQECEEFSSPEQWARVRFGVCRHTPGDAFPYQMAVTDGAVYHSHAACQAASAR